jgi:prevent-host-death family protein
MSDHKSARPRKAVGVRELKAGVAGILRHVREEHATYVVTHRGKAIGVLMPAGAEEMAPAPSAASAWEAFLHAGRQVERAFRPGRSALADLSSSRR